MQSRKQNLEKNRRTSLAIYMVIVTVVCLYAGLHLGVVYREMDEPTLFGALAEFATHMVEQPFKLFPTDGLMVGILFFVGVMINLYLYNEYLRVSQSVNDAHGDAAFEDNMKQYNKEFLYNPKVVAKVEGKKVTDRYAPYNEEHKRVLKHTPGKKAIEECQKQALILADGLFLALDGKWTQRNWNIIVFGASGAGKTRYFIIPNTLQLDGCYNYKYTAEADKRYLRANPYLLEFSDEEIEAVRVKPVGEEGYVEPKVVNSARKRALEVEKRKKAQAQAAADKELDKMTLKETDETKSKEQLVREMEEKDNMPKVESSEVLQNYKVSQMQILDSYSPMYEFE